MTRQEIDAVLDRVRTWPEDRQAYAAFVLLGIERDYDTPYELSDEDAAALEEAEREIERGEFATEEEVQAVLNRYRSS